MNDQERKEKKRAYIREYMRKYRAANPEATKAARRIDYHKHRDGRLVKSRAYYKSKKRCLTLQKKYGITESQYETMLAAQAGGCAICATKTPGGRSIRFHVDHDHETGTVRQLLCNTCNRLLGFAGDSIAKLRAAIDYLTQHGRVG